MKDTQTVEILATDRPQQAVEKKQYTMREHVLYASVVLLLVAALLGTAILFFTKPGIATFLLMLPVWFVCFLLKQAEKRAGR